MRTIRDLTPEERERILQEAPLRCYTDIAEDMDISIFTVKKVIRTYQRTPNRYNDSNQSESKTNQKRLFLLNKSSAARGLYYFELRKHSNRFEVTKSHNIA